MLTVVLSGSCTASGALHKMQILISKSPHKYSVCVNLSNMRTQRTFAMTSKVISHHSRAARSLRALTSVPCITLSPFLLLFLPALAVMLTCCSSKVFCFGGFYSFCLHLGRNGCWNLSVSSARKHSSPPACSCRCLQQQTFWLCSLVSYSCLGGIGVQSMLKP